LRIGLTDYFIPEILPNLLYLGIISESGPISVFRIIMGDWPTEERFNKKGWAPDRSSVLKLSALAKATCIWQSSLTLREDIECAFSNWIPLAHFKIRLTVL
jgi:hypothetical protein